MACDCAWGGDFLSVGLSEELIVRVKVLEFSKLDYENNVQMTVEIIENYKGTVSEKVLVIWGDRGHDCRVNLKHFKQGKEYILALNGLINDTYEISNCGEYYLLVNNGLVESEMKNYKEYLHTADIKVKKFKKKIKKALEDLSKNTALYPVPALSSFSNILI